MLRSYHSMGHGNSSHKRQRSRFGSLTGGLEGEKKQHWAVFQKIKHTKREYTGCGNCKTRHDFLLLKFRLSFSLFHGCVPVGLGANFKAACVVRGTYQQSPASGFTRQTIVIKQFRSDEWRPNKLDKVALLMDKVPSHPEAKVIQCVCVLQRMKRNLSLSLHNKVLGDALERTYAPR